MAERLTISSSAKSNWKKLHEILGKLNASRFSHPILSASCWYLSRWPCVSKTNPAGITFPTALTDRAKQKFCRENFYFKKNPCDFLNLMLFMSCKLKGNTYLGKRWDFNSHCQDENLESYLPNTQPSLECLRFTRSVVYIFLHSIAK